MRQFILCVAALCLGGIVLGGCSHGTNSSNGSNNDNQASATVPISLEIRDAPAGISVIAFQFTINEASLVRQDSAPDWAVVTTPTVVQLQNAVTNPVVIGNVKVPPTTYTGLHISFSNFSYWIQNNTGSTLTAAGSLPAPPNTVNGTVAVTAPFTGGCLNGNICKITPTLNTNNAILTGGPFPLTLASGATGQGLLLDFNVASAIQSDYSIFPTSGVTGVSVTNPGGTNPAGNMANVTTRGQITAVSITSATNSTGTFTFVPMNYAASTNTLPQVMTLTGNAVTSPTTLTGFYSGLNTACTTLDSVACLAVGQNVQVSYGINPNTPSTNLLTNVTLDTTATSGACSTPPTAPPATPGCILNGVQGTVISTAPFRIEVTGITANMPTAAATATASGLVAGSSLAVGQVYNVAPTGTATYGFQPTGFLANPGCAAFAAIGNVGVGQTLLIDVASTTASSITTYQANSTAATVATIPANTLNADAILLVPTQTSGLLMTNPGGNNPLLTLNDLSPLYGTVPTTTLNVATGVASSGVAATTFQGNLTGAVATTNLTITGLTTETNSTTGTIVRVSGDQFNSCSPVTIVGNIVGQP